MTINYNSKHLQEQHTATGEYEENGQRYSLHVVYGWVMLRTREAYFSMTGQLICLRKAKLPLRGWWPVAQGYEKPISCLQAEIDKAIPHLAMLMKWKGCMYPSGPPYYVGGAIHCMEQIHGCSKFPLEPQETPTEGFKRKVVFFPGEELPIDPRLTPGTSEHEALCKTALTDNEKDNLKREIIREMVTEWCLKRKPQLLASFEAELAYCGVSTKTALAHQKRNIGLLVQDAGCP
jgi:hypothetical protein